MQVDDFYSAVGIKWIQSVLDEYIATHEDFARVVEACLEGQSKAKKVAFSVLSVTSCLLCSSSCIASKRISILTSRPFVIAWRSYSVCVSSLFMLVHTGLGVSRADVRVCH